MKNPNTCGFAVYCADIPICRLECKPCAKAKCPVEKSEKHEQERKDGEVNEVSE